MDEFELFTQARELSGPDQRAAFLDSVCADDLALRRRVDALLANHRETGTFLEQPAVDIAQIVNNVAAAGGNSATVAEPVPTVLGSYEILEEVGKGGMGAVYKARHTRLDRIVALKLLPPSHTSNEQALARFDREMQAVGKLDHPHLVRAMDAGDVDGHHFLAMEFIEGCDLAQLVQRHGPLPVAAACELTRQAASGLQAVHDLGMVHRDIKPSNMMLNSGGTLKILDLGLALFQELQTVGEKELTSKGQIMGTLDYLAPEQCESSHDVDIRADLYSLGATLYFLLCGQTVFSDRKLDTPVKHLKAILADKPTSLRERCPNLPGELTGLVDRLLSKDPEERPDAPKEVAELLRPFCEDDCLAGLAFHGSGTSVETDSLAPEPTVAFVPAPLTSGPTALLAESPLPHGKKFRVRLVAIGLLAMLVVAAGYTFFLRVGDVDVKVTIDDPDLTVRFDDQVVTFEGSVEPIQLRPGKHGFLVQRGDITLKSDELTITKNGKNVLQVTTIDGKVAVVKNPQKPSPQPGPRRPNEQQPASRPDKVSSTVTDKPAPIVVEASIDRKAAEWVLEVGGFVGVRVPGQAEVRIIEQPENLPSEPFALVEAHIRYIKSLKELKLDGVSSLETLDLLGTFVPPDRKQLSQFKRLNWLRVSLADRNEWGAAVKDIQSLRYLSFYRAGAHDVVARDISGMTWVTELNMESCNLTNEACKHIAGMKGLERLNLATAPINAEGVRHLAGLPELKVLSLKSALINDEALTQIARMKKLEHLILVGAKITDEGTRELAQLTNLVYIFLRYTSIGDKGLMHLADIPTLRDVDVVLTNVTPEGAAEFRQQRPKVTLSQ